MIRNNWKIGSGEQQLMAVNDGSERLAFWSDQRAAAALHRAQPAGIDLL
jgi:hypothetical protein